MRSGAAHSLYDWLRLACAALLVAMAAPAALGPSMGPVLELLGGQSEHVCKCGMKPGTCGCPQCARDDLARLDRRGRDVRPVVKDGCHQDSPAVQFAALPPAAPAGGGALLPVPRGERLPRDSAFASAFDRDLDPPTPPPRLASV